MKELIERAESMIGLLENLAAYESADIDSDTVELRFEDEGGRDTGCNISIVDTAQSAADIIRALLGINQLRSVVKIPAYKFCSQKYIGSALWEETVVWNKAVSEVCESLTKANIPFEQEMSSL